MNPMLNFFEHKFTIFALLFLSGVFRCQSLFSDPDPKADDPGAFNPIDPLMSLLQQAIYATTLLLLLARHQGSIRAAIRDPLVWFLTGTALMSFLWSDFSSVSLTKGITTLQTTLFGLYMASRFSLKQQLQMLAWVLGIIAVFTLLFTVAFPGAAIEMGANPGAWRGPFVQKNLLARTEVLGAIVFLLLALESRRRRYLLWGGFGLCMLLIFLTGSKTALILFLVIVLLLPLYKALRWNTTKIIPLVITLVLIGGSLAVLVMGNWENLLASIGREPTLSGRTTLWEVAIELIAKRPWLGYGYQGFWQEGGAAEIIWKAEGYKPPHAHNGFVNMALDLGLVGLFLFLSTIAVTFLRSIAWLRTGKTTVELWPIFYITFFFMYNHSENTIVEYNSLCWALLVAVSLSLKRKRQFQPEEALKYPKPKRLTEPI